jgi:hypothetical protein
MNDANTFPQIVDKPIIYNMYKIKEYCGRNTIEKPRRMSLPSKFSAISSCKSAILNIKFLRG